MREVPLLMPKFSMTMEQGEIIEWRKAEGATLRSGDTVCDVVTDKVDMEVEAPVEGTLARIVAPDGTSVAVGEPIAYITTDADDLLEGLLEKPEPTPAQQAPAPFEPPAAQAPAPRAAPPAAGPPPRKGPIPAVPSARRRATELAVNLADIEGSGRGGLITVADVENAAAAGPSAPAPAAPPTAPDTGAAPRQATEAAGFADALTSRRRTVREAVARVMSQSATVPQFTAYADVDLHSLAAARSGIGWTTLLTRAFASTLRGHPELAAVWRDGVPRRTDTVGIALAVDTAVGLLAPVLTDPDLLPPKRLDADVRRLVDQARRGRLSAKALTAATATLSNLGPLGVSDFQALVTPPQVCALSAGAIREAPAVLVGALTVRVTCRVGLTVDHRAADGAEAARFLADLRTLLAEPSALLDRNGPG